jgi:hypothetical protein
MTQHAAYNETGTSLGPSAHVRGRGATSGRGTFVEFLGLTLVAGAFVLFVIRPEVFETVVHTLATRTAGLVH